MNIVLNRKHLPELLLMLNGYVVGGAVRDFLMERPIKDVDVATGLHPEIVTKTCKIYGWDVYPTGLDHGTVTVRKDDATYEVTTFRKDVDTDGRHAVVEFGATMEEDSRRRDFTMNALYMGRDGAIYDYHNGLQHIINKELRFVGDTEKRLEEDGLRIMRYFRFMSENVELKCRTPDLEVIVKNSGLINNCSNERIWSEFSRILGGNGAYKITGLMKSCGVLLNNDEVLGDLRNIGCDPIVRLHVLLTNDYSADDLKLMFALSNDDYKRLHDLEVNPKMDTDDMTHIEQMFYRYGIQFVMDSHMAQRHQITLDGLEMPKFPVTGQDLLDLGFKEGKILGQHMRQMEDDWLNSNLKLTKQQLLIRAHLVEGTILF